MKTISLLLTVTSAILIQYITRAQDTIFEANILTKGKTVTTISGGTHICDGINNNANSIPGPTITSTLDLAATNTNFTWYG